MAKKTEKPKSDDQATGETPVVRVKSGAGKRGGQSIITKKDGVPIDPPKKRGRRADPAIQKEKAEKELTKKPYGVSRPLDLKTKKKTAAEAKAERTERKKKAADAAELAKYALRDKIMDLRIGGASIRQISDHLKAQGLEGVCPSSIFNHLEAGLDHIREKFTLKYKNYIQIRLDQMYRVELSHFKRLCDTTLSPDDFEKLSRGMDRIWKRMDDLIDRLTDNHKTTKVEVTGTDGGPVETNIRVIMPSIAEPEADDEEP